MPIVKEINQHQLIEVKVDSVKILQNDQSTLVDQREIDFF